MEITLAFDNFDFRDEEDVNNVDRLRRNIFQRFPDAIWEKRDNGHTITI
jgi:hypothetical protein